MDNPLELLSTAELRARRSIKWRAYDRDVLPLWVAEMDTPLAPAIAAALTAAIARGDTGYAHPGRLAEAFAGFAQRRHGGWLPDPGRMRLIPDVNTGIAAVLPLVTGPGSAVVINTPAYPPFTRTITAVGRRVVASPLRRDENTGEYALDLDRLADDLARRDVSAYLLCHPHNPTGLVASRADLMTIADLASAHDVQVIVDEIHAPLCYPGVSFTPFTSLPHAAADGAVAFVSPSKAWHLPGLKAALALAPGDAGWATLRSVPPDHGAGILGVIAGEAAYTASDDWLDALLAGLDDNRRLLATLLTERLPGAGYRPPDATYLAWLDLRALGLGDDPAAVLLDRGRVALSAGPAFGAPGLGFARLNFATSAARLAEAVDRMAVAVE
ncbi:aminotransferase class I/II-fold pyridoxal phosphate-dependent enzyme [Luedemannella flava]|uniref:cysteine-S-conjugate beta-lyase n=1 Tax=Luedemannella flava TaxID=349316 RepID=A0ABP4YTC7_9ACTN